MGVVAELDALSDQVVDALAAQNAQDAKFNGAVLLRVVEALLVDLEGIYVDLALQLRSSSALLLQYHVEINHAGDHYSGIFKAISAQDVFILLKFLLQNFLWHVYIDHLLFVD